MKFRYHYSYNAFVKASVIAAILAGLFFVGFGLLNVNPLLRATPGTSDFYLFLGLLIVFAGFGLILSVVGIFYHLKMSRLNSMKHWFGITTDPYRLISDDYDIFKVRQLQINRKDIESTEIRMYRGNEFLHLNTKEKTYFLPIYRLSQGDKQTLLGELNKKDIFFDSYIRLTKTDLETVMALFKTFEDSLELSLKETVNLASDGFYRFGFDEDFPKLPHLKLTKCGAGGDTYSGYEKFRNEFDLLYFVNDRNISPRISLIELESDLGGYSLSFYFNGDTSDEKQKIIRETFSRFHKNPPPLPKDFISFLNSQP